MVNWSVFGEFCADEERLKEFFNTVRGAAKEKRIVKICSKQNVSMRAFSDIAKAERHADGNQSGKGIYNWFWNSGQIMSPRSRETLRRDDYF